MISPQNSATMWGVSELSAGVYLINYLITIAQIYTCGMFSRIFLAKRVMPEYKRFIAIICYSVPLVFLNSFSGILFPLQVSLAVNFISAIALTFLSALAFCLAPIKHLVFAAVGFTAVWAGSESISGLIISVLTGRASASFTNNSVLYFVSQAIGALATFFVSVIVRTIFNRLKYKKEIRPAFSNMGILLLLFVSILIGYYIMYFSIREDEISFITYFGIIIFICLISIDVIILFGTENDRNKAAILSMEKEQALTKALLDEQDAHLKEVQRQTHDYKNKLIVIQDMMSLPGAQSRAAAEKAVADALSSLENPSEFSHITSPALNAVMVRAKHECQQNLIRFNHDIQYSDFSFMGFDDFSTIFTNILDNAIYACKNVQPVSKRYLEISIIRRASLIIINVENSKNNSVVAKNGTIQSSKAGGQHGFGLQNVKSAVTCYGGSFSAEYKSDFFAAHIVIPLIT